MTYPGTDPKKLLHRVLTAPVILESVPGWIILLVLVALATSVGLFWRSTLPLGISAAGWLCFSLLDWGLLAGLPRTRRSFGPIRPSLLGLAVLRAVLAALLQPAGSGWLALSAMAALTGLVCYATWVEPFQIQVTEQKLAFSQWSRDTPPLRLLHLSDLHLERIGLREERLNDLIAELCPDLICFSGDILSLSHNEDPRAIADARTVIARWRAPLGVYAVTGSPLVDVPQSAASVLEGLPHLRWLCDQSVILNANGRPLALVGLSCSHNPAADGRNLTAALEEVPPDTPVILIYHSPDLAPHAARSRVDLQLSGHTHGGQIRAPIYGAIITSSVYGKRFEMGCYKLPRAGAESLTLYVSRGIGVEGGIAPRARFLCRPEIILWTLGAGPAPSSH